MESISESVNKTPIVNDPAPRESLVLPNQQAVIDNVNDHLDKIEQNLNSTTIICCGSTVEELIKNSTSNEVTNSQRRGLQSCLQG